MRLLAVVVGVLLGAGIGRAQTRIVLDEIVGSWLGDDEVQYVELRMLDAGQNTVANLGALVFDDATGSSDARRTAILTQNVARGVANAKILVASAKAGDGAGLEPDFVLPAGFLRPRDGRVCYAVATNTGFAPVDCVAYGSFTGDNGTLGAPTRVTPDNRVLRRAQLTGKNRADWTGALDPVLETNAGKTGPLPPTLCGDELISQGEECDGSALGGATCASLGFVKGKLACVQCHYDTSACTLCGNDAINGKEECDGGDLGERTCESIGYTGGELACTETCSLTLAGCDPAFFVPGGGPRKTDCLGEWRIASTTGGPNASGVLPARQKCRDGDAGCDGDGARNGTCVLTVAACVNRADARFAKCSPAAVASWSLTGKVDPADPTVTALVASVAALAPSSVAGTAVSFSPPLTGLGACGADVTIAVPVRKRLTLRARTVGTAGSLRDADTLRLACVP